MLRRAAELLFARHDPDHPNAGVRVFRVIGTARRFGPEHNVEERPRIEGILPQVLDATHEVVSGLLRRPSRLVGMRFQEMPEYPDFAWREALHNAVAHRDYAIQGSGTEMWLFEDRMEVVSAGRLPEGVTLEEVLRLERVHRSRNPRIVRVLVDLGFAKDQGEGIPRMFAEMEDAFLPCPEVDVRGERVIVTLHNTSTLTASDRHFVASLGNADLSRQEFRALLMAHRRGRVDNAALRSVTGLDTLRASHLLRALRDRELLTLHARGGDSFYTLTPAVREHGSESLRGADRGELPDGSGGAARADRGELPADRGELPADRGELPADRGELPADRGELPAGVRRAIGSLGPRPRKERLRAVIEAICAAREWTTSGDIARFLHFSQRNLSSRHLTPMVEDGRLVRRYPDNPTHPEQAYRATSPETPSEDESWITHAPFRCLGHRNHSFCYLPQSTGRVERIRVDAHTKPRLLRLAPYAWWETHFPGFESGSPLEAVSALFQESYRVGIFDGDRIRGRGCRRRGDGILVHLGDRLYPPASSRSVDPLTYHGDDGVYERRPRIVGPARERPLDSESARSLLGLFTEIDWEDDFSAYLLAGWTVLAPFCGALRWRPHVWLTGADGLSDTIITDLVEPLLAGSGLRFDGGSTRSRLLRGLDGDALPILYGGTTPAPSNRRHIRRVLQLAGTASSSSGVIGHGTPQGRPVTYRIRSMFCFYGMKVGRLHPDRSRISMLALRHAHATGRRIARPWRDRVRQGSAIPQLGSALLARTLPWSHDGRLDALLHVCRDAATTVFGDPRKGDQYGTLAAGAWLLLADELPGLPDVTSWLRELIEDGKGQHE
ncbi:ATP-binding protein [Candidatus Palauibacter sp.]|uniref:ATP-binding protein n=1 Tax=Candidatus Palauibacter sp. TaxID=3101350 RepID=UPI003B52AA7A